MRRPGEVVSKQVILEHVWDFAYDGDPEHRRGLRRPAAPTDRRTVRPVRPPDGSRVGYRLDPRRLSASAARAGLAAGSYDAQPPRWSRCTGVGTWVLLTHARRALTRNQDESAEARARDVDVTGVRRMLSRRSLAPTTTRYPGRGRRRRQVLSATSRTSAGGRRASRSGLRAPSRRCVLSAASGRPGSGELPRLGGAPALATTFADVYVATSLESVSDTVADPCAACWWSGCRS